MSEPSDFDIIDTEDLPDGMGCWCYDMGTDEKVWFFPIRAALWYGPERGWEPVKEKK